VIYPMARLGWPSQVSLVGTSVWMDSVLSPWTILLWPPAGQLGLEVEDFLAARDKADGQLECMQ